MSPRLFEPGELIADKYRVERVIGRGGMGVVVAARHVELDERFALKFLVADALDNPDVVERFLREGRMAVKVKSEHVARVFDVGRLPDGAPYLVMELLEGADLGRLLAERGPLPVPMVCEWLLQACEAVAEAHSLGIVHRDLKPENLFLSTRPDQSTCIKVLDFGISKLGSVAGTPSASMTQTSTVMGSPLYMSPEQMSSTRDVDHRTDIWALGVILFELLSGRQPFVAETLPQLCATILQFEPPALAELRPDTPPELARLCARCLEKVPANRFADLAELAEGLVPFAPNGQLSLTRIRRVLGASHSTGPQLPLPRPAPPVAPTLATWSGTRPPERRRGRSVVAVASIVFAASLGALAMWRFGKSPDERQPVTSAALEPTVSPPLPPLPPPAPPTVAPAPTPPVPSVTAALDAGAPGPGLNVTPTSKPASKPKPSSLPESGDELFDNRK